MRGAHSVANLFNEDVLIQKYINEGLSLVEMAKFFDVSTATIARYLRKYKIVKKPPFLLDNYINLVNRNELYTKYYIEKNSINDLCEYYKINYRIMKKIMKHFKIKMRKYLIDGCVSDEDLIDMYVNKKMSMVSIAETIPGSSAGMVRTKLVSLGVTIRPSKCRRNQYRVSDNEISMTYLNSIRLGAERRGLEFNITSDYILNLFNQQNGICCLSGYKILLTTNTVGNIRNGIVKTASLDRIDNSKGYIEGNVQWVHKDINRLKGTLTDLDLYKVCKDICNNLKTKFETECVESIGLFSKPE